MVSIREATSSVVGKPPCSSSHRRQGSHPEPSAAPEGEMSMDEKVAVEVGKGGTDVEYRMNEKWPNVIYSLTRLGIGVHSGAKSFTNSFLNCINIKSYLLIYI